MKIRQVKLYNEQVGCIASRVILNLHIFKFLIDFKNFAFVFWGGVCACVIDI